jgi:protein-tyrosine-phosphatase
VSDHRTRVLFVCIGNSCRSQMAEAFARALGGDVMIPASAGLAPAFGVAPDTIRAMEEKDILLRDHFPKSLRNLARIKFDLVVNMSQRPLPQVLPDDTPVRVVEWEVPDPIGMTYQEHCQVRDEIARKVMELIEELRHQPQPPEFRGQGSGRVPL